LIYSAGPVLVFFLGLFSLLALYGMTTEDSRVKILFVWLILLSFNQTFGSLMIGNLFKQDIGHVFNWMYFTDTQKLVVALLGFFGLLTTALMLARPITLSAHSYFNNIGEKNFPFFIMAQIIVPFIIGYLLIVAYFSLRLKFQESFAWISLSVIIMIVFINMSKQGHIQFDEETRKVSYSKILIIGAVIMFFGLRLLLNWNRTIHW